VGDHDHLPKQVTNETAVELSRCPILKGGEGGRGPIDGGGEVRCFLGCLPALLRHYRLCIANSDFDPAQRKKEKKVQAPEQPL